MSLDELEIGMLKLQNGDIGGLQSVYEQTKRSVFFTAFSVLRNKHAAEDVMQETYIRVKNNCLSYKAGTNAGAWIAVIAKNLALKAYNAQKQLRPLDEAAEYILDDLTETAIGDREVLRSALKLLDLKERQIVVLYAVSGFRHREIAGIMELPLGTELWLYNKALKVLRTALSEDRT